MRGSSKSATGLIACRNSVAGQCVAQLAQLMRGILQVRNLLRRNFWNGFKLVAYLGAKIQAYNH